jgi:hypothetical protein
MVRRIFSHIVYENIVIKIAKIHYKGGGFVYVLNVFSKMRYKSLKDGNICYLVGDSVHGLIWLERSFLI